MTTKHKFKVGDRAYREPTRATAEGSFIVTKVGTRWLTGPNGGWDRHAIGSCFPTQKALDEHLAMVDRREALARVISRGATYTWHRSILKEDIPVLEAIFKRAGLS